MNNKIELKQGDLCLFDFNTSIGHEYQGKRPALIIESDQQLRKTNLITVIPLTSNTNNRLSDDVLIEKNEANRLMFDSLIKVHNIVSLDYQRFINTIGMIDNEALSAVKKYLRKHFGLF